MSEDATALRKVAIEDLAIDHALAQMSGSMRFLLDVTPVNSEDIKAEFVKGKVKEPTFRYRDIEADPEVPVVRITRDFTATAEQLHRAASEAGFAFGPAVEVYLDGGTCDDGLPSTILDCTKPDPVMLRRGTITPAQLREVLGPIDLLGSTGAPLSETPQDAPETDNPQQHESASNPAPESTDDERTAERQRLEAMGARARAGEATQAIPLGGIGAEPPFEPESVTSVELPGRPGEQNH